MAAYARKQILTEGKPGAHLIRLRCAEHTMVDGVNPANGKSYRHRRLGMAGHLRQLRDSFAMEVPGWSVEDRAVHLVLVCRPELARKWAAEEVVWRWIRIFEKGHGPLNQESCRSLAGNGSQVAEWRRRLTSVSWFMRTFGEKIAREANREDGRKGAFWFGRFDSWNLEPADVKEFVAGLPGWKPKTREEGLERVLFPGVEALPPAPPPPPPRPPSVPGSRGERRRDKLSSEQVLEIFRRLDAGERMRVLAQEFGVSPQAIDSRRRHAKAPPRRLSESEKDTLRQLLRKTCPADHGLVRTTTGAPKVWGLQQIHQVAERRFGRPLFRSAFKGFLL